jgi:hypothetical protein
MGNIGDPYVTLAEIQGYLKQPQEALVPLLTSAIHAASDEIETYCNRQFNKTMDASARVYTALTNGVVYVDDFWTTEGLVIQIDSGDTGAYDVTVSATDYSLEPKNGIVGGQPGWPFNRIYLRGRTSARFSTARSAVRVTAKWGWNAVPDSIKQACFIMATERFKLKDTPFGVAGFNNYGEVRVRQNPLVEDMLKKFRRNVLKVG